jgi:hypothetical protein
LKVGGAAGTRTPYLFNAWYQVWVVEEGILLVDKEGGLVGVGEATVVQDLGH